MDPVCVWLIIMVTLIIFEAITVDLVTIWFVGGALVAMISAAFGGPVWLQTGLFAGVSCLLLLVTRPLVRKYIDKNKAAPAIDRLIGKEAIVTERVDNIRGTGEVQVEGQFWGARSLNPGLSIDKETVVVVRGIHGVRLIVEERDRPEKETGTASGMDTT